VTLRPSLEARARLAWGTDARRGILAAIRFPGRRTPVPCLRLEQWCKRGWGGLRQCPADCQALWLTTKQVADTYGSFYFSKANRTVTSRNLQRNTKHLELCLHVKKISQNLYKNPNKNKSKYLRNILQKIDQPTLQSHSKTINASDISSVTSKR